MIDIDVVIPSFKSEKLTSLCIRSFEKYKGNKNFRYIIVENSNDTSYKENILELAKNIKWIQNPTKRINAEANAEAVEKALLYVESEYVLICHNDVVACRENWIDFLIEKMNNLDCIAAGYVKDNIRINALHISGMLVKAELIKGISLYPVYQDGQQILDVGDAITQHFRKNNLKYYCCRNTHNNDSCVELCKEPYRSLYCVDRALDDDNNVIFLHLGRGTLKALGTYWKTNRVTLDDWVKFVEINILS